MNNGLEARLRILEAKGVTIVDRRQTYLDELIEVDRIYQGAVLCPGTRLVGARTFVGPGAKVGTEGPAIVENAIIGANAEVASGYVKEAVLLRDSRVGAHAHIRPGTLLEEEASTAHAVGLKHTILMSFVTLGSLINFCDALISGGRSRQQHTEVGSGFIHFNFTPRGQHGDKATPSLIGGVPHGAFLRQRRIFLGGLSGMVGPQKVGFGAVTIAGQILRREIPADRIVGEVAHSIDKDASALHETPGRIVRLNLEYIGHLIAMKAWYRDVRLQRIPNNSDHQHLRIVTQGAFELLSVCVHERIQRITEYLEERALPRPKLPRTFAPCPLKIEPSTPYIDHVKWVSGLADDQVQLGVAWLQSIVDDVQTGIRAESTIVGP